MAVQHIDDHSADLARRFLLGRLPDEEGELFEVRLLAEDGLAEVVQAVEEELLDEFVRGGLTAEERKLVAARFESRPERVQFATALATRAQQRSRRPLMIWLASAAAAVLVVVAGALTWRQPGSGPVAPALPPSVTGTGEAPPMAAAPVRSSLLPEKVAALTIALATSREGAKPPRLDLDPDTTAVALTIRLHPADRYPSYSITVNGADGRLRWWSRIAAPAGNELVVNIPVASLTNAKELEVIVAGLEAGRREELGSQLLEVTTHGKAP
jgi:hypothetical protein